MRFKLVHIHIGKTGGTSLAKSLEVTFGSGTCSPPFIQSFIDQEGANYYNSFEIIHGHISRDDQIRWFHDRKILTILRDPVSRGFSFLRYVRSLPPCSSKIAADANVLPALHVIDTEEGLVNLNNAMVRQLGGHLLGENNDYQTLFEAAQQTLREAIWVGRQDDMPGSLKRLACVLGDRIFQQRANVTSSYRQLAEEEKIRQRLLEIGEWDQKLWDWASRHVFQ